MTSLICIWRGKLNRVACCVHIQKRTILIFFDSDQEYLYTEGELRTIFSAAGDTSALDPTIPCQIILWTQEVINQALVDSCKTGCAYFSFNIKLEGYEQWSIQSSVASWQGPKRIGNEGKQRRTKLASAGRRSCGHSFEFRDWSPAETILWRRGWGAGRKFRESTPV